MVEEKTVSELMKEFVAELMLYLRQRGKETVTHVVVEPLTKAGLKIALLLVAAAMGVLAVVFLGIFMVYGFATVFGGSLMWGYLASAVLILIVAAVLMVVMSQVGKEERKHGKQNGDARGNGHRGGPAG